MDDRELLELAAKAAGIKARWFKVKKWRHYPTSRILCGHDDVFGTHHSKPWNPLEDDGDALRLAVKLCMNCDFLGAMTGVIFINPSDEDKDGHLQEGPHKGVSDLQSARRAIVRAAAEIGRAM